MAYHYSKIVETQDFDEAIKQTSEELKKEGFGVLTEIDLQNAFKNKLNVDFRKYKILGACNPQFAHKALLEEEKIGVFLPCNVVVQQHLDNSIEVSIVNPIASMISVENQNLGNLATEIQEKLLRVLENLN